MSYFTDQLMTAYLSGGSTINGATGGDRWAGVLSGQIGGLSEPLHLVDADFSGSLATSGRVLVHEFENKCKLMKNTKNSLPTENTPRNQRQPGDRDHLETTRDETRPTRYPYSTASIDSGFMEIGLVQLPQSVKTTNVTHTHTDKLNNGTLLRSIRTPV